jgi:hypothetical protein
MYSSYMLYQAEQVKTARQQQEADIRTGEVAAEFGRLWHSLAPRRSVGQRGFRRAQTAPARVACSVPSCQPRAATSHRH